MMIYRILACLFVMCMQMQMQTQVQMQGERMEFRNRYKLLGGGMYYVRSNMGERDRIGYSGTRKTGRTEKGKG